MLANIRLSDRWFLIPEFLPFSVKGAKDVPLRPTGDANLDALLQEGSSTQLKLKYLDMPVIAQFRPTPRWSFGAGPHIAYLIGAEDIFKARVNDDDDLRFTQNVEDELNSWDLGIAVEAGFTMVDQHQRPMLGFHARYTRGFTDVLADNTGDAVYTSVFQFVVSLPFVAEAQDEDQ